jgi:hypothetical protein
MLVGQQFHCRVIQVIENISSMIKLYFLYYLSNYSLLKKKYALWSLAILLLTLGVTWVVETL